jgi:hypothetical protein
MCFNLVVVPLDKNATHIDLLNMIHESDIKAVIYTKTFEQFLFDNRKLFNNVYEGSTLFYIPGIKKPRITGL